MATSTADGAIDIKRYDRQIRLWGLDTQRGLVGARILLLGANGLANEIAKNLVLAGVGHVRIQDPGTVDTEYISGGGLFSVSESQLGQGRAEALAEQLKAMNPSVELVASQSDVASLDVALLQTYQFIIGTRGVDAVREISLCTARLERHSGVSGENADPQSTADEGEAPAAKRQRANGDSDSGPAVAKSNGTHEVCPMRSGPEGGAAAAAAPAAPLPKFLAAGTLGLEGFCFFDLGAATTMVTPAVKTGADPDAPKPVAKQHVALYPTVAAASRVEWASLTNRVPRLYYALQLLLAEATQPVAVGNGKDAAAVSMAELQIPSDAPAETVALLRALHAHRTRLLGSAGSNAEAAKVLVSNAYLADVATAASAELSPVSAIVGGMVASEVIKVISGKETPINNAFFFNGETSDGIVQRLGPSFECPWGVDKGNWCAARE